MTITGTEIAGQPRLSEETKHPQEPTGRLQIGSADPSSGALPGISVMRDHLKSNSSRPAIATDAAASMQIEPACNTLKSVAERLLEELKNIKRELQAERATTRNDLEGLLDFLNVQKKLIQGRVENSAQALRRGETAEAQAILAAQSRLDGYKAGRMEAIP